VQKVAEKGWLKVVKKVTKGDKNTTWEYNHSIIRDSYVKLIKNLKRKPTQNEVAIETNLSRKTIQKHTDTLKFEPHKHPLRILSDDAIISIISSARKGNAASQKLWFQIMEGWTEKQVMEHEGGMNINDARKELIKRLTEVARNNRDKEISVQN